MKFVVIMIDAYSKNISKIVEELKTDTRKGLDINEVSIRQSIYGNNKISMKKSEPKWLIFIKQFNQSLVYILILASLMTLVMKEYVDSAVIFGVVLINSIVGFIQEVKAVNALEILSEVVKTEAVVLRDRKKHRILNEDIVPGDIVYIKAGDKIPADIRFYELNHLKVEEASLTGESVPVLKQIVDLSHKTILSERVNMVYASTFVTNGSGKGIVVATAMQTEIGKISKLLESTTVIKTPLVKKINKFSQYLLYLILGLAFLTFVIGVYRGESILYMLKAVVALAVSTIPEGLPAAITATLAIGVARMAKRNAIVRKLSVVETLGSSTVICSDKTGTLRQNQMTVKKIWTSAGFYDVSGQGYHPQGSIIKESANFDINNDRALKQCLINGVLCNDSWYEFEQESPVYEGDPTEICLYLSAIKANLNYKKIIRDSYKLDTLPFDSEKQYMATLYRQDNGLNRIYIKGALERLLSKSDKFLNQDGALEELNKDKLLSAYKEVSSQGMRVLTFAYKDTFNETILDCDMKDGFVFVGFQGIIDPPRSEVIESIKNCHSAGIVVKMITGDHMLTAEAIAKQLGIVDEAHSKVLCGDDLDKLDDNSLASELNCTNVFARATPAQKLRIVEILQRQNNIVAMTGDGVNDAPALKRADIGIAMGITGTEVSKDAADMILIDDNFATIEAAVNEGRGIFDNITKFIAWTLPTNVGEGLIILIAILLGVTLPVTPIQILWINMTTAIFLGLMLAFEPKEYDIMSRKPNDPNIAIFNKSLIFKTILVGLILVISAFSLFWYELFINQATIEEARTVATTVFVVVEAMYLLNSRSLDKGLFEIGVFSNKYIWVGIFIMMILQLCFIYLPFMNVAFETSPISFVMWVRILVVGLFTFILIECQKKLSKNFKNTI